MLILLIVSENFHVAFFLRKIGKNFIFHNSCMSFASRDLPETRYFNGIIFVIHANYNGNFVTLLISLKIYKSFRSFMRKIFLPVFSNFS
jgi:hypothetical protein